MLDAKFIRENPDKVKENINNRGLTGPQFEVDDFLKVDDKKRSVLMEIEGLRGLRNKLSGSAGKPSPEILEEAKKTREQIKVLEDDLKELDKKWQWYMEWLPNMLDDSVPVGAGEDGNVEVKAWSPEKGYFAKDELGKKDFSKKWMPKLGFESKDHLDLGESLDIIDNKQSALVSGSRFTYLKKEAVLLQYALFDHLKSRLVQDGFIPMVVPLMVKREALFGSSHFPGDEDQVYRIDSKGVEEGTGLYLVGSSEPSLFAYYMDKVVLEKELPQKFFAVTTCFRTEVGSWGKDVRGIKRVHQFDKLEMDLICRPEESEKMHEYLLSINEWFLQSLEIPYHVILMCSSDAGYFATSKKYDFEAWLPHTGEFVELGSDTNAKDYQARRYNIRYRTRENKMEFIHTVNDTGCAVGRTLVAILENYQQEDGSVVVPKVLRQYMGGLEVIKPKTS
jgi:seryl-tRNA synthetase